MNKSIYHAAIFGILSLIFIVPISILSILNYLKIIQIKFISTYILLYIISIIFYVLFIWGFITIGKKLNDNYLINASFFLIIGSVVMTILQILSPYFPRFHGVIYQVATLIILGGITTIFGSAILRLKTELGKISKTIGILNIISGISFITVIFSFIGIILLIPLYILEIILLFRISEEL